VKRILILLVALACTLPVAVVQAAESVKPAPAAVPAGFIPDYPKLSDGSMSSTELELQYREYKIEAEKGHASAQYLIGWFNANGKVVKKDYVEAIKWYRKAAEQGNIDAQFNLSNIYSNDEAAMQDSVEAFKWFRKAADQGNADAQFSLGLMCARGNGVSKDSAEAAKWYRKAADQGHAVAQYNLGLMYANGEGVPKDSAEAAKWYRSAADQGNANAQNNLGKMYEKGDGVSKDSAEAVKCYFKSVELGDADAQHNLGLMYANGDGVLKNSTDAVKWYRKSAEQGDVPAQRNLGFMYENGDGVSKDSAEAVKWYRKSAEQGNASAQTNLGLCYLKGTGVAENSVEAAKWFQQAAAMGYAEAQFGLGLLYAHGDGLSKNSIEAVKWLRKAAEQGHALAQNALGICYINGEGVLKDIIEALAWFNLAAISGEAESVKNRDIAEAKVGPQGTLQAQQRSKEIQKLIEAKKSGAAEVKPSSGENPATISAKPKANGSGALVTQNGYILTAAHVVSDATRITVLTSNGEKTARVIRVDEANDLAVLKIEGASFSALPVAPSRGIKLGQNVATIGFPNVTIQGFSPKLTRGEISSLNGLGDDPRSWQISAPVQPGNSGGPLLDEYGNLIGVIVSKLGMKAAKEIGDIPQNVNYAVKSAYASALLDSYLGDNAPEPKKAGSKKSFEEMVSEAQKAVVLILVY